MNRSLFGKIGTTLGTHTATIRSSVLTVAAFALLTAAGFEHSKWAGMGAAAVSLLALDWLWSTPKAATR